VQKKLNRPTYLKSMDGFLYAAKEKKPTSQHYGGGGGSLRGAEGDAS
jgi:hypothetical protein